jgi:hypothetical protein
MPTWRAAERNHAPKWVCALDDHEVTILERNRMDLEEDFMGLESGDVALRLDKIAELSNLGQTVFACRLWEGHGDALMTLSGAGCSLGE